MKHIKPFSLDELNESLYPKELDAKQSELDQKIDNFLEEFFGMSLKKVDPNAKPKYGDPEPDRPNISLIKTCIRSFYNDMVMEGWIKI